MRDGLERAGAGTVALTQRVINCDSGSAASGRLKVSPRAEYLCTKNFCRRCSSGGSHPRARSRSISVKASRTLLCSPGEGREGVTVASVL